MCSDDPEFTRHFVQRALVFWRFTRFLPTSLLFFIRALIHERIATRYSAVAD